MLCTRPMKPVPTRATLSSGVSANESSPAWSASRLIRSALVGETRPGLELANRNVTFS